MAGCYVIFHKQLGDLVLLEPALRRLREHHGAPIRLLTRTGHAALVSLMEGVSMARGLPLRPQGDLYCFDPRGKSALRAALLPVARRTLVLPDAAEMLRRHRYLFHPRIVPGLGERYIAEYFWDNTPVPANEPFRPPELRRPPDGWAVPDLAATPFLLINPTSGWQKKTWTAPGWQEAVAALRGLAPECRIVMTSGSNDWQVAHCREVAALAGGAVESLASGTTLEQFLWLCSRARAVVTVDGAATHLAAAFGVPSLTLFGPTSRANWHHPSPLSRSVQAPPSKDGEARMRNLAPSTVTGALGELLG